MPKYRAFVVRHYIDVVYFDIEASTGNKAWSEAEKLAKKLIPDSRARATDNHWRTDTLTDINEIGYPNDEGKMVLVRETKNGTKLYMDPYDWEKLQKQKSQDKNGTNTR